MGRFLSIFLCSTGAILAITILVQISLAEIGLLSRPSHPKGTIHQQWAFEDIERDCKEIRLQVNSENKMYSRGFDNAVDLFQSATRSSNPPAPRFAGCILAMRSRGEAVRFFKGRLGITPSETMPAPGSLPNRVLHVANLTWPALVTMEKFGLLSGQEDTAQAAKRSLLSGISKLFERNASVDCITKFVHTLTHGLQALDLAGQSNAKRQILITFAATSDAEVGSMIDQCSSSLPESCMSICS